VPRKTIATLAALWVLAYPTVGAWGAVQVPKATKPKAKTTTVTVNGPSTKCHRWGQLVIRIKAQKTVNGKKVTLKITKIDYPVYPKATFRSVYINDQALPLLIEEALEAQGPNVETISGATDVTVAFKASLQGAILAAKKQP
jgi:uncharacterized protein with FMN-binding domain